MDFIESLPKSEGKDTMLVVVNGLTKYNHFIPLGHPFTVISTFEIFFNKVIKYHGLPKSIVSDRDKVFISNFWKALFKMMGTQFHQCTSYHPQIPLCFFFLYSLFNLRLSTLFLFTLSILSLSRLFLYLSLSL